MLRLNKKNILLVFGVLALCGVAWWLFWKALVPICVMVMLYFLFKKEK